MRCTLICIIVVLLLSTTAAFAGGTDLQWSSGISFTEKTDQSGIFSRIEVFNRSSLIGAWFSTSGFLPVFFTGLTADVIGDFPGINKIEKVWLSPDKGKSVWQAELVEDRGYVVQLPPLTNRSYSLEWAVRSRDKHNRVMLLIIPINYSGSRTSYSAHHLMVQNAPLGWESFTDAQVYACLQGFVSAQASPDPAIIARMQFALPKPVAPVAASTVASSPTTPVMVEQPRPAPRPVKAERPRRLADVTFLLDGSQSRTVKVSGVPIADINPGDAFYFRHADGSRGLEFVADSISGLTIYAAVTRNTSVKAGDTLIKEESR